MQMQNQNPSSVPVVPVAQQQMESPFKAAVMPSAPTIPAPVNYAEPQAAMASGGLLQEGGSVDPVSGNEVPAGSLKEEVRDDIPAQLSEGEFVFPADVVRFIGLERLMQMRQAAKEGLAKMEAMGQMGNADEATMDDTGEFETEVDDIFQEISRESPQQFAEGGMPMPVAEPVGMAPKAPMMDLEQAVPQMQADDIILQSYADKGMEPDDDPRFQEIMSSVATNRATMIRENDSLFVIAMDQPGSVKLHMFTADAPEMLPDSFQKLAEILQKAGVERINPETSDPEVVAAMQDAGMDELLSA
jgi:hypothetical protein